MNVAVRTGAIDIVGVELLAEPVDDWHGSGQGRLLLGPEVRLARRFRFGRSDGE